MFKNKTINKGENMNDNVALSDFVGNALIEISNGIRKANTELKCTTFVLRRNIGDSNKITGVKFDVAVSASDDQKDGAGLKVALFSIGGAANMERRNGNEQAQRIQFEIGVKNEAF